MPTCMYTYAYRHKVKHTDRYDASHVVNRTHHCA